MIGAALRETGLAIGDIAPLAKAAEDAGYDAVWFPELGARDAFVLAGLAAHATDRISVGTGVVPMLSRSPVALAIAAATVAEASGGRFCLGLGTGSEFTARAWYDADWKRPRHRLAEIIRVVRSALAGERVAHHGLVRVEGFHLTTEPPPVPIYLGALSAATLRLAGEVADGVLLNWLTPPGAQRATLLVREAAADAHRSVVVCSYIRAALCESAEDLEQARGALREQVYLYAHLPAYNTSMRLAGLDEPLGRLDAGDETALDDLVDALCAVGDADTIRSRVRAHRDAGVDQPVVYPVPFGDDPALSVVRTLRAAVA